MAMITLLASPLIQVVIEKVADGLSGELQLLRGVHGDMVRLQSILSTIKDVLDDAENKAIGEKALCSWLKKLKDAAYDADDVVDTFCTEALRQQIEYHDHFMRQLVRDFFSSQNPIIFRRGIARKLKHVLGRLDEIAAERVKFHLTHGSVSVRHVQPVETNSAVHELEILGRDEDKEKIVHFLINEETDKDLAVLAVVGLGGIGKTALAQLVYNDDRVTPGQFFDLRIWICVSDVFDVKEIARKLMECVKKEPYHNLELETLSNLVRDTLSEKRFFLVLDNVWNVEPAKWESLQTLLKFGRSGSKIVTTTRNEVVADVMGSVSQCCLKVLSADDCWTLFSQRAFKSVEETANLTKIGKEIVEKCGGLPLAAKALGSLMSSKKEEFEWLAIRDSEIWQLTNENEILPALNLSFYHLPSHLKNCFVYCSLFPKDYKFGKKELIRLWISEGFIPPSTNENISPQDAGNECFNSLLWRSFFQDVKKHSYYFNDEITCKMHDLVHDLACSVAKDEFQSIKYQKETKINDSCRYLSLLVDDKSPNILDILFETKKLRSLILIGSSYRIKEVNPDVFVRLRNLRVLNLSRCRFSVFPSTICRLKHLRFLDISNAGMKVLPSSIGCLYNLQTLILRHCYNLTNLPNTITNLHNLHTLDVAFCDQLVELPRDIRKMKNLRHLDNKGCSNLSGMPMEMGQLTNLETLPVFIVGEEEEEGQHITELQHLNQIRGFLCIKNLRKVTNPIEAREANLRAKTHVKSLCLDWGAAADVAVEEEVIASLVPPPNLEILVLQNYLGINYPSNWMIMSSYNSLETIKLYGLRRCASLPPLGQLPSLKILEIWGMDAIRRIGEEFYGEARGDKVPFHKLEELYLIRMKNLEEWVVEAAAGAGPGDIRRRRDVVMFPWLTKLVIDDCPKLKRVHPSFPVSVVDLYIKGEVVLAAGSLSGMNRVRNLDVSSSSSFWEGLQYLTALEKLTVSGGSSETTCLPEGLIHLHIPTLRTLKITQFEGEALTTSIAAGLQQQPQPPPPPPPLLFTSLHNLILYNCQSLTVLPEWVGDLTSLQRLELSSCPKLEMLSDGLQHLTALQQLDIRRCPILEKRCEREIGEDWHKIKHIPHIQIKPSS